MSTVSWRILAKPDTKSIQLTRPLLNHPSRLRPIGVLVLVIIAFTWRLDGSFLADFRNRWLRRREFLLSFLEREPQTMRTDVGRFENNEQPFEENVAEDAERHSAITLNTTVASRR